MNPTDEIAELIAAHDRDDDALSIATRCLLIDPDPETVAEILDFDDDRFPIALRIAGLITKLDREPLTDLLLEYSLCPLHRCDYAICFDDDTPACRYIRIIHPGHDS